MRAWGARDPSSILGSPKVMKKLLVVVAVLVLLGVLLVWLAGRQNDMEDDLTWAEVSMLPPAPEDASYRIDDTEIQLEGGVYTAPVENSSAFRTVRLVGDPAYGSLTEAEENDAAVVIVDEMGGSGSFYYLAVALKDAGGYLGTNAVLLGDRVDLLAVEIDRGIVRVRYRTHGEGEALSMQGSDERQEFFRVSGAGLERIGPLEGRERLLWGVLSLDETVLYFAPCESGVPYRVASMSRADALLRAVYALRTDSVSDSASITVAVVAEPPGSATTTATTGSDGGETITVRLLAQSLRFATCQSAATSSTAAVLDLTASSTSVE